MRCRNRPGKRSIALRMRGTSAMSMPVPTIMGRTLNFQLPMVTELLRYSLKRQSPIKNLQQPVTAIDQPSVHDARFGSELMRPVPSGAIDMLHLMTVSHKPIRYQHTMTAEIYSFRTHVGCRRLLRQ